MIQFLNQGKNELKYDEPGLRYYQSNVNLYELINPKYYVIIVFDFGMNKQSQAKIWFVYGSDDETIW